MTCRLLLVSRSGYCAWGHRPASAGEQSNRLLAVEVKQVFDDEKGRADAPRVAHRLKAEGVPAGRHRVARAMRDNGLRAKAASNSKHPLPVAPNLLGQNFLADKPGQNWVPDITYIWTDAGRLYLAVMLAFIPGGSSAGQSTAHGGNVGV